MFVCGPINAACWLVQDISIFTVLSDYNCLTKSIILQLFLHNASKQKVFPSDNG